MKKLPTVKVSGKDYVLVKDRVLAFNEAYPEGSITTELVSKPEDEMVIVKATVKPSSDGSQVFTGYSQATWGEGYINKTSALENCETSAVGRALAFMGIGVLESIASADEINKATTQKPYVPNPKKEKKYEAIDNAHEEMTLDEGLGDEHLN